MLKKYLLALFLFLYSPYIYAGFWSDFKECLRNPCNCGAGQVGEYWNGKLKDPDADRNPYCPPYNKKAGREGTCLLQFDYPNSANYFQHCAEATKESTYFEPKIRVRYQSCNFAACWTQSTSLDWNGECVMWPTSYGLPLVRVCARVAVPSVDPTPLNPEGSPADYGYTKGFHLTELGETEADEKYSIDKYTFASYNRPKLCAYSDPGLLNLISNTGIHEDVMDYNPVRQPLHASDTLSPLAKVLKSLLELSKTMSWPEILGTLLGMLGSAADIPGLDTIQEVLKYLGKALNFSTDIFIFVIEKIGKLNSTVDSYQFGCVELPLGPFPPPYCPKIAPFISSPSVQKICSKKNANNDFIQNSNEPCVISNLPNNIINNSVRISLDRILPLCKGTDNPTITDKCVKIRKLESMDLASIHIASGKKGIIPKCLENSSADTFCVDTKIDVKCSVTANGCNQGIRVVYGQKIGNSSRPQDYYVDNKNIPDENIPDCSAKNAKDYTTCQEIWGVNLGEFADVSLPFPPVQGQKVSDFMPVEVSVTLSDNTNKRRDFSASVVYFKRSATPASPWDHDPKDICVSEGPDLVGCIERANTGYKILTYECGQGAPLACKALDYYNPQFIAKLMVEDKVPTINGLYNSIQYTTTAIATPLSISGPPAPADNPSASVVNLAGYNFNTFMAYIPDNPTPPDNVYSAAPFSGSRSFNPLSIYGIYENGKAPYNYSTGEEDTSALYLYGLEYQNGKYIQGGTHGCMMLEDSSHCSPTIDETNCVLAKLTETDPIKCKDFANLNKGYAEYPGYINFRICTPRDTNCSQVGTQQGITIHKCDSNVLCYKNTNNPGVEVCKVSSDIGKRIDPSPSEVNITDKHYTVKFNQKPALPTSGTVYNENTYPTYDQEKEGLRDKTAQELLLCAKTTIPKCPAITSADNNSGNATWGTKNTDGSLGPVNIGTLVDGICKDDWVLIDPSKPLKRYCLSSINDRQVKWATLPSGVGCQEFKGLVYTYDSNMPKANPVAYTYDTAKKSGTFILGKYQGGFPAGYGLYEELGYSTFTFKIPNKDAIKSFKIILLIIDDYALVKVNDVAIFSGPDKFSTMVRKNSKIYTDNKPRADQGRAWTYSNIDVLSHLINGDNTLTLQAGVVGGGGMYYKIVYELK